MKSTMIAALASLVLSSGCADVSSEPWREDATSPAATGLVYSLPRGLVPVRVFADSKGIGVSIEPAYNVADQSAGFLIARVKSSFLNRETISLKVDETGLLSLVSSDAEARSLELAAETAKFAGRLAFQSGKEIALAESVTILQRDVDPLSDKSVADINDAIAAGIFRAASAHRVVGARSGSGFGPVVSVSVHPPPVTEQAIDLGKCRIGICVRVSTARTINVSVDGGVVASKVVSIPSWQVLPIAIPQSVLSDQKITVVVKDGMLVQYGLVRDVEFRELVKIPDVILGSVTQGLTDDKSTIDAQKSLLSSEAALATAQQATADQAQSKMKVTPGAGSSTGDTHTAYRNATLTIYLTPR